MKITAGEKAEEKRQIEIILGVPEGQRNKASTEILSASRINTIGDIFAIISQFNLYCITLIKQGAPNDLTQPCCVLQYIFTSMFDKLNNHRVRAWREDHSDSQPHFPFVVYQILASCVRNVVQFQQDLTTISELENDSPGTIVTTLIVQCLRLYNRFSE